MLIHASTSEQAVDGSFTIAFNRQLYSDLLIYSDGLVSQIWRSQGGQF